MSARVPRLMCIMQAKAYGYVHERGPEEAERENKRDGDRERGER